MPGQTGDEPAASAPTPAAGERRASRSALPFTRWNFWVISLDAAWWTAGLAFVDVAAVLPILANTLTDSKLVVGLLTAMPGVGWSLLQLPGAANVLHRRRKKKYLLSVAAVGRAPMLAIPALLLFTPFHSRGLVLGVLIGCYAALFLSDGLLGAAWYDIIAKTIPARSRGRFFATMSVLGALGALGAGWVVKRLLGSAALSYPHQYGVLYACLCAGLLLSYAMVALIREPEGPVLSQQAQGLRALLPRISEIWRGNRSFRGLMVVAWLTGLAGLAWPFFSLYGIRALGLPVEAGAAFIWAGTLGNMASSPLWGWLNDRNGPRAVLVGAAASRLAAPVLALGVPVLVMAHPALGPPRIAQYLYAAVFLCTGALAMGSVMGFANYLLELASPEERPLVVGLGYTLSAPALLAPLLGGWLVSAWCYQGVFALAVLFGIVSLIATIRLSEPKGRDHLTPYLPPESGRPSG